MDDREWAAKWVGWHTSWCNGGQLVIRKRLDMRGCSDAELAEAVRVKLIHNFQHKNDYQGRGNPSTWALLAGIWMNNGPLAFIKAVREMVDE